MADVSRITPLDGYRSAFADLDVHGLQVTAIPHLAQINLRGTARDLATPVAEVCAMLSLAPAVNTVTTSGTWHCLGLGPDEWLLVGPPQSESKAIAELAEKLAGQHASVLDVTANRVAIDISGPATQALIASLTGFDLATLTPGRCAQTMLAKAQVVLQAGPEPDAIRVFVRNSFARYLADVVIDAVPLLGVSAACA
jgi:sarcosine oxidase subunit gamma